MAHMEPVLDQLIDQLAEEEIRIHASRHPVLDSLAEAIRSEQKTREPVRLNFICTHNSRRSQMAQIWAHTAATAFQIPHIETYSGGTEATAFHPNAVRAMRTLGFRISPSDQQTDKDNPRFEISVGTGLPTLICYSKRFVQAVPSDKPFIAVMTCSDADQNCPLVPGAKSRIPLTFKDPKAFDGTEGEQKAYLNTAVEIGREVIRVFRHL